MYEIPFKIPASPTAEATAADVAHDAWAALAALVYPPRLFEVARRSELTPAMLATLLQLEEKQTMGELAGSLNRHPSNVTAIVDGLEERGLAGRFPYGGDRRIKVIDLTAAGRELRSALITELNRPPDWLLELPPADQETLRDIVKGAHERSTNRED